MSLAADCSFINQPHALVLRDFRGEIVPVEEMIFWLKNKHLSYSRNVKGSGKPKGKVIVPHPLANVLHSSREIFPILVISKTQSCPFVTAKYAVLPNLENTAQALQQDTLHADDLAAVPMSLIFSSASFPSWSFGKLMFASQQLLV